MAIALIFGLIYGSFLNVVILRFDDWVSILKTPSHCPKCQRRLSWLDLIPLISFIFLRGRCRYCRKPISWQYPVVELSAAALLAGGYYLIFVAQSLPVWREVIGFVLYVLTIGALITIFFHDLYEMMIPDILLNFLVASGLLFSLTVYGAVSSTLIGGLIGFGPIALLVYPSRGTWMGEGDVKLATGLGLMLGYPAAIAGLLLSFLIGGLYGIVAVGLKKVQLRSAVPFGPFLIIGGLLALFFGRLLIDWYLGRMGYGYY